MSSRWLTRLKECNNLLQYKLCGKSADVLEARVFSCKEHLGSIISGYERCKTSGTWMKLPAKKSKRGKTSKGWLTVAFFVSATRKRRKPVVIRKYANPRCLKNINKDIQYLNQQKAWMTSDILHKLLSQLNTCFKAQNRSILLFDSAGRHPYDLRDVIPILTLCFFL